MLFPGKQGQFYVCSFPPNSKTSLQNQLTYSRNELPDSQFFPPGYMKYTWSTNSAHILALFSQHDECDDICVICQDDLRAAPGGSTRGGSRGMSPVMKVRMLDCGHMFHDEVRVIGYTFSCVDVRARS